MTGKRTKKQEKSRKTLHKNAVHTYACIS